MKRIAIVTATRAEYGLLRWTIEALRSEPCFDVRLIVTGTHLSPAFGEPWREIEADGLRIDERIDYLGTDRSPAGIAREMSVCARLFADCFSKMAPDLLLVLGDRYELLPVCSTALVLGIPIAHIAGGEHTEGALDERVRNAVTMMATLHFPNSPEAARELVRMTGSPERIFNVGEPCVENSLRLSLPGRKELAGTLGLDPDKDWYLCTLHPETCLNTASNLAMARALIKALQGLTECEIILSEANADPGGAEMNALYRDWKAPNVHLYPSLGQTAYQALMREARCVVGNSSSGVIETPLSGTPAINIGDRQKGRRLCPNVISCGRDPESIREALERIGPHLPADLSFGDGHTSEHIVKHIKAYFDEL